jgi:hypothetical protein
MSGPDEYVIRHAILQASEGNAREATEAFEAMLQELAHCKVVSGSRKWLCLKTAKERNDLRIHLSEAVRGLDLLLMCSLPSDCSGQNMVNEARAIRDALKLITDSDPDELPL